MKLRYPLDFIGITQFYSQKHQAIDLGWHNTPNEKIYSCGKGIVTSIYEDVNYGGGLTLVIDYENGFRSEFKHLSSIIVKLGEDVGAYQHVAFMGESGWGCSGAHLHLNLYNEVGNRVNPIDFLYVYEGQEVSEKDKNKVLYYNEEPTSDYFPIGTKVKIKGYLYYTAFSVNPSGRCEEKITEITRVVPNAPHPYNTFGDLGWIDKDDAKIYEGNDKINLGDFVYPSEMIDYYGTPVHAYDNEYKVTELVNDRAVLGALRDGAYVTWCAMNVNNLTKIK